uniref:Uncharacterized protein n=1 Tax=Rhizophora mucronata TaxID=61149 RepID=A0A2P2QU31_RHIMU
MSLMPLMLRSLARSLISLMSQPVTSVTTILYYSDLLPRNLNLDRLIQRELVDPENHLFHFIINILRCFW